MRVDRPQRQRRRVRAAHAALARIAQQRDRFATAYSLATSPHGRFSAAAAALRGAAAAGRHQPDQADVDRQLDLITAQMTQLLDELHAAQTTKAHKAIAADQRRLARRERKHRDSSEHPLHTTQPDPREPSTAA